LLTLTKWFALYYKRRDNVAVSKRFYYKRFPIVKTTFS